MDTTFYNSEYTLDFPRVMRGPSQNVGPIGSAVLTFIGYTQTDRQAKYLYMFIYCVEDILCIMLLSWLVYTDGVFLYQLRSSEYIVV